MFKELDSVPWCTHEELKEKYSKLYKDYKLLDVQFANREQELTDAIDELTNKIPRQTTIQIIERIKQAGLYNDELDNLFNEFIRYELNEINLII